MDEYKATIGLEVHAELKTKTKMFCDSPNDPEEKTPNVNVCAVCMGHPGTLPVINKEAVKHVLKMGRAVGGTLADFTEFDRKNYFYPDIPKGYQISQYQYPLVSGGELAGVALTRIHLEEDTARSSHDKGDFSLVDFNRAGVPLMELVTEPVVKNSEEAGRFARELQLLLRTVGASDANMEKGEMRVEANISVSKDETRGTKVEVKNLNSFRAVERAIEYEIKRQSKLLREGGAVVQETRGWNEAKQETFSQRKKESSHDYRYFPDPDLPKLYISEIPEFSAENLDVEIPELPWERRERYHTLYGLKQEDVEMYVTDPGLCRFFEDTISFLGADMESIARASNYITSDLAGLMKKDGAGSYPAPEHFAGLITMVGEGKVSSRGAKDILEVMYGIGGDPLHIAEERGLLQKSDAGEMARLAEEILAEHTAIAQEYKNGKESALQFLVGQGMKKSKGSANPQVLADTLKQKITG